MAKTRGDGDQQEPTLELPALFGRGKKRRREHPDQPAPVEAPAVDPAPAPVEAPVEEPASAAPTPVEEPPAPTAAPIPEPRRRAAKPPREPRAPKPPREPRPTKPARAAKPQRAVRTGPVLPTGVAAVVVGLVVGLAGTALTYVSLRGCEMLKGTESCGAPGLGLLVVIIVLMVLGGALLLGLLGVSEPRGTSFLAIGLMCVIVLVTLMEDLFSVWMFVAVPLICAATYALAHWVTTQFVETADDRPHVDVR